MTKRTTTAQAATAQTTRTATARLADDLAFDVDYRLQTQAEMRGDIKAEILRQSNWLAVALSKIEDAERRAADERSESEIGFTYQSAMAEAQNVARAMESLVALGQRMATNAEALKRACRVATLYAAAQAEQDARLNDAEDAAHAAVKRAEHAAR